MNAASPGSESKNTIKIDVGSNPKLKDYFSRLEDGHTCKLEIEFTKVGMTGDMLEGSVVAMAPEDYEEPVTEEAKPGGEVKPNAEKPVAVSVGPTVPAGDY